VGCAKKAFAQAPAVCLVEHVFHIDPDTAHCETLQGLRGPPLHATIRVEKGDLMEDPVDPFANFLETILALWTNVVSFLAGVVQPGWRQNQVIIVIVLAVLAWLLHRKTGSALQNWVRTRDGWETWQLRAIVQLKRRLGLIWFSLLAWAVYLVMQNITWPSRSYLIGLAATLAIVWVGVAFAARLVRNRLMRRVVTWSLWIYATLYFLNVSEDVGTFLDDIALELGDFRLSILSLITAIVVIGFLVTLARVGSQATASTIRRNEDISPSMQVLAVKGVQLAMYGVAFYIGVKSVGIDLTGLAVLSGAIGVGLGFGLQKVVSNLVSGVIILLDKSIKPGDVISLGETFGWIQTLGARYASVVTRDGKEYLIPNEDLITGQVVNWSHSNDFVRLDIYFGTAYGDDPHVVRKLAIDAAASVNRVLADRAPVCHIVGFGDSSVDYILRFWIKDPTGGLTNIRGHVYLALWDTFQKNDISIPFPQREVKMLDGS
jgi:small-conductance mechanosensitive channel